MTGGGIPNTRGSTEQRFIIRSALTQDRGYYPPNQRVGNPRGGAISEVGVNWGTYPSLANLVSWFGKIFRTCACTRHIISTRGWPIISQEAQQPLHAWSCSGITSKKEMTSAVLVIGV
jgi:hypothetical protein